MVQRPTQVFSLAISKWFRLKPQTTELKLVGLFEDDITAGLASKPGDTITRVPCFSNIQDYKRWREDKIKQSALSKLSEEEKKSLDTEKPLTNQDVIKILKEELKEPEIKPGKELRNLQEEYPEYFISAEERKILG
jgi:hypothetical protein